MKNQSPPASTEYVRLCQRLMAPILNNAVMPTPTPYSLNAADALYGGSGDMVKVFPVPPGK